MTALSMNPAIVVGIDPSLACTGIAVHNYGTVTLHCVRSKGAKGDSWETRGLRLEQLLGQIVAKVPTDALVVMEAPSYASASTSSHDRSGLWWLLHRELSLRGHHVLVVTPAQRMMYATGKGRADKDAVMATAVRRYPDYQIGNNDEADAVLFMAIGLRMLGRPVDELPKTHLRALDKLSLPDWVREAA